MIKRLVHLLIAEISFNVYLEYLKNMLEVTEGGFTTHHAFELIDIRGYKYLDIEGIKEYMVQYNKNMRSRRASLDLQSGTNSKFYKAIMRRMGIDATKKINYQEFANFLKPSIQDNVKKVFHQNQIRDKVNSIVRIQGEMVK